MFTQSPIATTRSGGFLKEGVRNEPSIRGQYWAAGDTERGTYHLRSDVSRKNLLLKASSAAQDRERVPGCVRNCPAGLHDQPKHPSSKWLSYGARHGSYERPRRSARSPFSSSGSLLRTHQPHRHRKGDQVIGILEVAPAYLSNPLEAIDDGVGVHG